VKEENEGGGLGKEPRSALLQSTRGSAAWLCTGEGCVTLRRGFAAPCMTEYRRNFDSAFYCVVPSMFIRRELSMILEIV
jgi:hypothetical protein